MARASTTSDIFNAIAEPRRRQILAALGDGQGRPVGWIVDTLGLPQPAVSKHLAVLKHVGIVAETRRGRSRIYRLNPQELKPVHDWISTFEKLWTHQLDRIKRRAELAARTPTPRANGAQEQP
jgi:DNA-binding transcriptional ArsR family regulator